MWHGWPPVRGTAVTHARLRRRHCEARGGGATLIDVYSSCLMPTEMPRMESVLCACEERRKARNGWCAPQRARTHNNTAGDDIGSRASRCTNTDRCTTAAEGESDRQCPPGRKTARKQRRGVSVRKMQETVCPPPEFRALSPPILLERVTRAAGKGKEGSRGYLSARRRVHFARLCPRCGWHT